MKTKLLRRCGCKQLNSDKCGNLLHHDYFDNQTKWIIKDWAGNILFRGKKFASFEDGWGYVYEHVNEPDGNYEDYYVISKEVK